jgi:hypothetical protein
LPLCSEVLTYRCRRNCAIVRHDPSLADRHLEYGYRRCLAEQRICSRRCDRNAPPYIAAHWLELERTLAVFDLAEGLIIAVTGAEEFAAPVRGSEFDAVAIAN